MKNNFMTEIDVGEMIKQHYLTRKGLAPGERWRGNITGPIAEILYVKDDRVIIKDVSFVSLNEFDELNVKITNFIELFSWLPNQQRSNK
jgi:hypothetical protein